MNLINLKDRITFSTAFDQTDDVSPPFSKETIGLIKIKYDGEEILFAIPNQESKQLLGPGEFAQALESAFEIEGQNTVVALEREKDEKTHRTIIPLSLAVSFQNQISQQESSTSNSLSSEFLPSYELLVRKKNQLQPEEDEIKSMKTDDAVISSFSSGWGCSKLSATTFTESATEASNESDKFLDGLVANGEICGSDANMLRDSCEETSPTRFTVSPITSGLGEGSTPLGLQDTLDALMRSEEASLDDSHQSFEDLAILLRHSNHLSADLKAEVRVPTTIENALDALVEHERMTVSDRDFLVASFDDSEVLKTVYEEFLSFYNSDIFLKIVSVCLSIFISVFVILEKQLSQL
jgi:hypothetical protein